MTSEAASLGETFVAHITFEWFLVAVSERMAFTLPARGEFHVTGSTAEWFITSMYAHVSFEIALKSLPTYSTCQRLLTCVFQIMSLEGFSIEELVATNVTHVIPHSSVRLQVFLEVTSMRIFLRTLFTFERLFSSMGLNVSLQVRLLAEGSVT